MEIQSEESPFVTPPISGFRVLLGLLLTLLLHCFQLFPFGWGAVIDSNKLLVVGLFFGFTQFFYMLPAIILFKRRNDRSLVIGLIIGASLTFLVGLPFAGLGYLCATEPAPNFH